MALTTLETFQSFINKPQTIVVVATAPLPTSTDICWYKFKTSDVTGSSVYNWATSSTVSSVLYGSPVATNGLITLGTGKYINLPTVNLSPIPPNGFTISMWINISTSEAGNCTMFCVGNNNSYNNGIPYSIIYASSSNCYLTTVIGGGGTGGAQSASYPATHCFDGNWHLHTLVLPFGGSVAKCYYDGVLWGSPNISALANESTSTAGLLAWGPWYINAGFSDIRMYNTALSVAQVGSLFTTGRITV